MHDCTPRIQWRYVGAAVYTLRPNRTWGNSGDVPDVFFMFLFICLYTEKTQERGHRSVPTNFACANLAKAAGAAGREKRKLMAAILETWGETGRLHVIGWTCQNSYHVLFSSFFCFVSISHEVTAGLRSWKRACSPRNLTTAHRLCAKRLHSKHLVFCRKLSSVKLHFHRRARQREKQTLKHTKF